MKYSFIISIILFSSYTVAGQQAENGIEVIGKASLKAEPDQFVFTVSINQRGTIASKAKALVDQKSRLVTNMYLSLGINKNAIESARLQLIPRYVKQSQLTDFEVHQRLNNHAEHKGENREGNTKIVIDNKNISTDFPTKPASIYFEVIRDITVTFSDFTLYDQLLDNVVKIGVSRISPLQTTITNSQDLYQQALIKALKNANQKAEAIAKQIGVKLGKLSRFEESSYHTPSAYMMASRSSNGFSSQVAQKNVSAEVHVTFTIK